MTDLPRRTLEELATEAFLSGRVIVVVEGPSDVSTYSRWLIELGQSQHVFIEIEEVDVPQAYLANGNRELVLQAATSVADRGLAFVVDRDLGVSDLPPNTYVTDFPGIESYAVNERVLQAVGSEMGWYGGRGTGWRVADASQLTPCIGKVLRHLFRLRELHSRHVSERPFLTSLDDILSIDSEPSLNIERVRSCLALKCKVEEYLDPDGCSEVIDAQHWAYGHDVAPTLWALFRRSNTMKAALRNSAALERILFAATTGADVKATGLVSALCALK